MKFRVGIENNNEGIRSIAWVLEHPGCYAYGEDQQQAIANTPAAIQQYAAWIAGHGGDWLSPEVEIEIVPEQVWTNYQINEEYDRVDQEGYDVEPFFEHDWKPLTETDIQRGLKLLAWSRADLLAVIENLTPEQWAAKKDGERWDVAGIVKHIGGAEWWYLDRLGLAFPREEMPKEPLERLEKVRGLLNARLVEFKDVNLVVGKEGEFWSPRKVLRRALWHEQDHSEHICKVV